MEGAEGARVQSFLVKPPGFSAKQQVPGAVPDPRRAAGRLGRELDLPLERAGVRRGGLRGGDAQPARLHRLRAEVHRRDQQRLGRPRLRRHHGRGRPRGHAALRRSRAAWRRRAAPTAATWSNWILGHTARFKALVSHAGVYDLRSMFGETEELWFPLWEFGGTPWDNPETYARWSPSHFVEGVPHAHAGDPRGAGFPRAVTARGCNCSPRCNCRRCPRSCCVYPGRGPLDPEAAEQRALVQDVHRLDR